MDSTGGLVRHRESECANTAEKVPTRFVEAFERVPESSLGGSAHCRRSSRPLHHLHGARRPPVLPGQRADDAQGEWVTLIVAGYAFEQGAWPHDTLGAQEGDRFFNA